MTAKFKQIIEQLNALIASKDGKAMSDEDFIANLGAVSLLCNLYNDLGLDQSHIRKTLSGLYPELSRRIHGKNNMQFAMPLIKGLDNLIYGEADDLGPAKWHDILIEMCRKIVEAYHNEPLIDSTDYLFALDIVSRTKKEEPANHHLEEYKKIVDSYLEDIDAVSLSEQINRVKAYNRAKHLFASDNRDKWAEVCEVLKNADTSQLDDQTLILWREITDITPMKGLKKRSAHSKRMQVEYLRCLIINEFKSVKRAAVKRKLARELKSLNEDIINDIIPLKIDSGMSVSTLHALETIFYLRLQLAQARCEETWQVYSAFCSNRLEQLATALTKKFDSASSLNDKIEILERLVTIGLIINSDHFNFAIEEAEGIKDLPGLTFAQKLRLDWLPNINPDNESQIVADLLPEATTAFEMETIALVSDFITAEEREAVLNRYLDLFNAALSSGNAAELGKLLTIAANWNSDPAIRPRLTEAATKAQAVESLTLPERRLLPIAAEIYQQIDTLTGKYADFNISA